MPQGHVSLSALDGDLDGVVAFCRVLGMRRVIMPWLPPEFRFETASGWTDLGQRLAAIGKVLNAAGLDFAYHNHAFEFQRTEGVLPMDLLLAAAPDMGWEPDLGWVMIAGLDMLSELTRRADRVVTVHFKDVRPEGDRNEESGWADLGAGIGDWGPIFQKIASMPRVHTHVFKHDNPSDLSRFLARTKATIDHFRPVVATGGEGNQ